MQSLSLRIGRLHDPNAAAANDATGGVRADGARGRIARFLRCILRRMVRRR
jgi:hypothetical protein